MHVSRSGLVGCLLDNDKAIERRIDLKSDDYVVTIPAKLNRCGIETKLIIDNHRFEPPHERTVKALQDALRHGLQWHQALVSGNVSAMAEIAKQEQVTPRYIGHLTSLAFLAPDSIEAIFQGDVPTDLSLKKLKQGFPLQWDEQRKQLRFSA